MLGARMWKGCRVHAGRDAGCTQEGELQVHTGGEWYRVNTGGRVAGCTQVGGEVQCAYRNGVGAGCTQK